MNKCESVECDMPERSRPEDGPCEGRVNMQGVDGTQSARSYFTLGCPDYRESVNPRDPHDEGLIAGIQGHRYYSDGSCANCEDPKCSGCFGQEVMPGICWRWPWFRSRGSHGSRGPRGET